MRNLTNVFLESAPSRFKLSFGVNNNVMLKAINNEVRRDKNGGKINKNCYMTFSAVDVEENNKIKAETVFSYFTVDKPQYAVKGFIHQYNQMMQIAQAVIPVDAITEALVPLQVALTDEMDLFVEIQGATTPTAKLTKKIIELQEKIVEAFIESITPYLKDKGDLVSLLVVTGPNGQFLDLPREDKGFISKMEGGRKLTIDAKYVRWFEEKDKKEKAKGDDIGGEEILAEEELLIEDDVELEL